MKDYKLLLAGLILLLLVIIIGIFAWLWSSNRKNMDPLPIMVSTNGETSTVNEDDPETVNTAILYVQAEDKLQSPLDDVIARFESRYPTVQIFTLYVNANKLLTLPNTSTSDDNGVNKSSELIFNTDIIMANDKISKERLAPLQALLKESQAERNKNSINADHTATNQAIDNDDENAKAPSPNDNKEARNLASFSYALRDSKAVDGVILTENPAATSFRNFLLSSVGQDILKQHDYENIEGYRNNLHDLFNPTSRSKSASNESSIQVADALSNGK